ncbi:MAG: plasmid protein [Sulfolobus sp.]
MVSKEDVKKVIIQYTGGDGNKAFTKSTLLPYLGLSKSNKSLDKIFDELLKEGFIKLVKTSGNRKYYTLAKAMEKREEKPPHEDFETLKNVLREVLKEYFELYFGHPKTTEDLDKVYDFVKDDLGMASIKDIREQMGMTLEQFMAKFRDYIIRNYELISGGKEGIVKGGVLYGIIRRRK